MPVQNLSMTSPAEVDSAAIARRRAMAEALQNQSMQPVEAASYQGIQAPLSVTQGLAKMLQAYMGRKGIERADTEAKALAGEQQARRGADVSTLINALGGRKASPGGLTEDASGNVTQADSMAAQSPVQALGQAVPMMGPEMQPIALQAAMGAQKGQEDRAARLQERMLQIESAAAQNQGNQAFQEKLLNMRADLARELAELRANSQQDRSPYYQFLQTPHGYMAGNARTGQVTPVTHEGQQVMPAQIDPTTQGNVAAAKKGGQVRAESQADASINLPATIAKAEQSLMLIDQMVGSEDGKVGEHPGFQSAVGARIPGLGMIPGSDTASFNTLLDQVKGGAFLQAFESIKGGGHITEIEGEKATNAITRMNKAQPEAEFKKAAREFQSIIRAGVGRAKIKAGGVQPGVQQASTPEGIDPELWQAMTPEERALWGQ